MMVPMQNVTHINGRDASPADRRREVWSENIRTQMGVLGLTPKKLWQALQEEGCDVTMQAVYTWTGGKAAPGVENQAALSKVLRAAPHMLFPVRVTP